MMDDKRVNFYWVTVRMLIFDSKNCLFRIVKNFHVDIKIYGKIFLRI
jgi:hypothetical protein